VHVFDRAGEDLADGVDGLRFDGHGGDNDDGHAGLLEVLESMAVDA
jgi:hypothetical protein